MLASAPSRRIPFFLKAIFLIVHLMMVVFLEVGAHARPLSIDDVLRIQTVDGADISSNGDEIAISMSRPAGPGEVYGRNAYEIDPSRNDIWLVKRDGSDLRALTNGRSDAAGYWCPHWSPNSQKLAMLSTAAEGAEPRGGDSARLYVWNRTSGALRRVSNRAMMTQVRYGGGLNPLDLRSAGEGSSTVCRSNDENAPFLWLDDKRLLAVLMPEGERSAMVDRYAKFHREAARAGQELREGEIPTVSRSDSRIEGSAANVAELVVFDLSDGSVTSLGTIPAFPMFGTLSVALSPNGERAAVLAARRAIPQHLLAQPRLNFGTWEIENTLFVADLEGKLKLTEVSLPADAQYPVDLVRWSLDSRRFAVRARPSPARNAAQLWALDADTLAMVSLTPSEDVGPLFPQRGAGDYAFWTGDQKILVLSRKNDAEMRWRITDSNTANATEFSSGVEGLTSLTRLANGTLVGKGDSGHFRYDREAQRFVDWPAASLSECKDTAELSVNFEDGSLAVSLWTTSGPTKHTLLLNSSTRILDYDCTGLVVAEKGFDGSNIRSVPWDGDAAPLMERNTHLTEVQRGDRRIIDYAHADGSAQKMAVMFPPDYDPSKPYPTLFWVYGGYSPRSVNNFFFDPHMAGFYNLELYAGQGYVVVIPSIPIPHGAAPSEPFSAVPGGVLPALDELVRLGITDEASVGIFGQSFGGYVVNALVAQTDRFAAAASIAGASDLATNAASFDPAARGWRSADQDMSANQGIYESALGFRVDPGTDPALYHRNSPLTYVDQITTPLLLIHGELDSRAPLTQVETLYSLLRRRGRPVRLLRYWGENHSLANSPANVRDISQELLTWFDEHLKNNRGHDD